MMVATSHGLTKRADGERRRGTRGDGTRSQKQKAASMRLVNDIRLDAIGPFSSWSYTVNGFLIYWRSKFRYPNLSTCYMALFEVPYVLISVLRRLELLVVVTPFEVCRVMSCRCCKAICIQAFETVLLVGS